MQSYETLQQLIANDSRSRQLYDSFTPQQQVAVNEQRQNIHTHTDLERLAAAFQKQSGDWQAK
ncbi:MAG: hypothetical protein IJ354_08505 [Clostridia bacterium]|nr:hypothetical protein [Clostridia bacterium]